MLLKYRKMTYFCNMKESISELRRKYISALEPHYGHREAVAMLDLLLDKCFGISKLHLIMNEDEQLDDENSILLKSYVDDLLAFRPVQHIIGSVDFCGCVINVSPDVMIPRPETAEMVSMICDKYVDIQPNKIVDICAGSGCIAIALAKRFPKSEVRAIELSEKAIEQAAKNAHINEVNVEFVKADVLNPETVISHDKVDLIVSNPPYICESEKSSMQRNVLDYEPSMALFVPNDNPLVFYEAILKKSLLCLSGRGEVWLEINEFKQQEMSELCKLLGFAFEFYNDINGKCRFCRAWIVQPNIV